ncbi:histone acetyltransferase type B catalytic subunit [Thermofilum pendens]|uniref:Uncharacterized protein n=1 Tax=Thermofilum pendens (strain DSM 2475 / Hrk 5) TaxID=368408 RepID=A1RXP2_THEPD|nr:hypothetical protein [Thermofilum pendens]ABL77972.1 hypothetical protein Tpen_0567 [Thermofilum pendens Hrk 5]
MSKKPYPHNDDIVEAILEVLGKDFTVSPEEFPSRVKEKLEEKGFYAGLVSEKRVWSLYEKLVKSGRMPDYLGVVPAGEERSGNE